MATPIVMPRLGDFMTEGVVTKFTKAQGDNVTQGEVIAEIETEKVNYDLEATVSGVFHPSVDAGATVAVDDVMGYLLDEGEEAPAKESSDTSTGNRTRRDKTSSSPRNRPRRKEGAPVPSTPGARKLAVNLGVDLQKITSTGPRGRIVEADVRNFAVSADSSKTEGENLRSGLPAGHPDPVEETQLRGIRKAIASNMKKSLTETAQYSFFFEVDVTDAQEYRREAGVGLTEFLIKASGEAIKRVPAMNSVIAGDTIYRFDQVNVAMAVALENGLVVPVIEDVGNKSLKQIAEDVKNLSTQAREGKIKPDQLVGGTFTISVLGSVDGFTPILNQGQVGLLGVGRSNQKPVVQKGEIVIREMMTLSLTGDHQAIDGAVAGNFCRRLQQLVENPSRVT
ncbi:MAG: dihydrolipoamide acetyltransferase family protein [Chloroflexota bacterium]|nr:dihydrolipoamide acetyltransferase family protein [Chloroflexota bacterium]